MNQKVLVVGASGVLGGAVARALLANGVPVRALSRTPTKLAPLASLGAEVVRGDVLQPDSLRSACEGAGQVFNSANSLLGSGATSPAKIDIPGMVNLVEAAGHAGVWRLVHTSSHGILGRSVVDFFRVKARVDDVVTGATLPWVLLKPSAYMETWVNMVLDPALLGKPAPLFGGGLCAANLVAVADVAAVATRILADPSVRNEAIEIGGPSTMSPLQVVELIEQTLGRPVRRRSLPVAVLRVGARLLRPFAEVPARFMALGFMSTLGDRPMDHWRVAATRFAVNPISVEAFIAARLSSAKRGS
jgi:NADH dehydrogenase